MEKWVISTVYNKDWTNLVLLVTVETRVVSTVYSKDWTNLVLPVTVGTRVISTVYSKDSKDWTNLVLLVTVATRVSSVQKRDWTKVALLLAYKQEVAQHEAQYVSYIHTGVPLSLNTLQNFASVWYTCTITTPVP